MTEVLRACPLCAGTDAREFLATGKRSAAGGRYRVVECANCGLRFTRPLPTDAELTALYGEEYYGDDRPRALSWDTLRRFLHRLALVQRRPALLGRRSGRILDVGCGDGDFLASLRRRGWEVHGTEFSAAACRLAAAKGVTVHQGDLASARFPDNSFDVATVWHVLEHLSEPLAELAEIRRVLRDDGLLVAEVPNSASPTLSLCGEAWLPLGVPGHLQHFTPTTLQRLLRGAGFAPVRRQNYHYLDFALSFISFMNRLGVLGRAEGGHYFVTDYRRATTAAKGLFLALGLPVGALALPYSIVTALLGGNSETVTITARKAPL